MSSIETQERRPLNLDDYLSLSDYATKGNILTLSDQMEIYQSGGVSKNGVILLPDYYGWDSGRIRNFCDFFGDKGYYAVIPRFSTKPVDTQKVKLSSDTTNVLDWYKSRTFDGYVKPAIMSILDFMKTQGVETTFLLGFSWGGWAAINFIASEMNEEFVGAVLAHPSLELEERIYGGSITTLMNRVNRPFLLITDKGDPESYSSFVKMLHYKLPNCRTIDCREIDTPQFLLQGNIGYRNVHNACVKCVTGIMDFFRELSSIPSERLNKGEVNLGPEVGEEGKPSSWDLPPTAAMKSVNMKEHLQPKGAMLALNINQYMDLKSYTQHGSILSINDGFEMYVSGSPTSTSGIIILPDYYGWDSGRIRNMCDFFGDNGYYAVVPRFSSKEVESEEVKSFSESAGLLDWYKSRTLDGKIIPATQSMVDFMKRSGINKIFLLGFSWGGWVALNLLASDICRNFVCGVLVHPILNLEEKMYGGSLTDLMSRVSRPFLLIPDKGDPETYSTYVKMLKYRLPTCDIIDYEDIDGQLFLLRGNDENVREACVKSVKEVYSYFDWHASMNSQDLCLDKGFSELNINKELNSETENKMPNSVMVSLPLSMV